MKVGVALGMKYMDLKHTIENDPKIPHHLKPMEMFQKWRSTAGDFFTYETLAPALEKVGLHTCAQTYRTMIRSTTTYIHDIFIIMYVLFF